MLQFMLGNGCILHWPKDAKGKKSNSAFSSQRVELTNNRFHPANIESCAGPPKHVLGSRLKAFGIVVSDRASIH